jgi:hypothetical protein
MESSTPLLLLLDGLLSGDVVRIQNVIDQVKPLVPFQVEASALLSEPASLHRFLKKYVEASPHIASVKSLHDGSLPLHFAASWGDVEVARLILERVRPNSLL